LPGLAKVTRGFLIAFNAVGYLTGVGVGVDGGAELPGVFTAGFVFLQGTQIFLTPSPLLSSLKRSY